MSFPIGEHVEKVKTWNPKSSDLQNWFKYIDLSSVDKNDKNVDVSAVLNLLPSEAPSRARQLVQRDDVLVSTVRPNLNGVAMVPDELDGATASTGYSVLRANNKTLCPNYLKFWVQSAQFISDMVRKATGANYPAVTDKVIKESRIPLPPLETQKQIAAVLEKADQLRKDCQQMEQELNNLAQSVFIDMFGDPVNNPKGWDKVPLSTIVSDYVGGKSLVAADDDSTEYRNKVLKISAVTSGEFKSQEVKPLPNDYEPPEEHFVRKNDLLFSRANTTELVGATTMVFDEFSGLVLPDKLWRLVWVDEENISSVFVWQLLTNIGMRAEISKLASGSGGSMKNISKGKLKTLEVILPPKDVQEKYEEIYLKLRAEKLMNKSMKVLVSDGFSSLMQRAFKGELNLNPAQQVA
ncbi:restriction endonuclease subunit S [Pontibacterium sinense]|nr:restriction endonuclease subunit S [Pontibacterium sinense]